MSDSFNLEKIEGHIKNIESEVILLLRQILDGSIPNRESMINRDYFIRLQKYDILNNTRDSTEKNQSPLEDEPKNTVQFIKSILENIPADISERKRYLEKLLGYFGSISANDKMVLIQSLLYEPADKIKAAIQEILAAFS
ncbi:MAG: hypothetical protein EU530_09480 [Promethearchaeota archaeon]|nr:MAG: hypothetical protein EU530_09480 [Candidatus Lokiarchaeota archaeon]